MNIDDVIKEEVQQVDVDKIELPENQSFMAGLQGDNGGQTNENGEQGADNKDVKMSLGDLCNTIIMMYNGLSVLVYKKLNENFDGSLTEEEVAMLKTPLKATLQQYNVEMSPVGALCMVLVSINVGKLMQLKFMRQSEDDKVKGIQQSLKPVKTVVEEIKEKVSEKKKEKNA